LGNGHSPAQRAGPRCARDGDCAAQADRCHPPLGSGQPIHRACLRRPLPRGRRAALDGLGRGCV
jgi:hypothetical protein